jgi:hypothetical protein
MEFTKEELLEIEKVFDIQVLMLLQQRVQVLNALIKLNDSEAKTKLVEKIRDDIYQAYNCYREISAKAHLLAIELK